MSLLGSLGRAAWRRFVTDGVPSSGVQKPSKTDILAFVAELERRSDYVVVTANRDAAAGDLLDVDTRDGVVTVKLPANPAEGDRVGFSDFTGSWGTNRLRIDPNGKLFEDLGDGLDPAQPLDCTTPALFAIVYSGGKYRRRQARGFAELDGSGIVPAERRPMIGAAVLTAGGAANGLSSRIGRAVRLRTGKYSAFPRGSISPDESYVALSHFEGDNHGSGDSDGIRTATPIDAAGALTCDGQYGAGGGASFLITLPVQVVLTFSDNDADLELTFDGIKLVNGVETPATVVYAGMNKGFRITPEIWKSGTIASSKASRGNVEIGIRNEPSSLRFFTTSDGGRTQQNEYFPVRAEDNEQGYQTLTDIAEDGTISLSYFAQSNGGGSPGTWLQTNKRRGLVSAWSPRKAVKFNGGDAINGARPVLYTRPVRIATGARRTLMSNSRSVFQGDTTNYGENWTCTEIIRMGRLTADMPVVTYVDQGAKTFKIDTNKIASFPTGRKFRLTGGANDGVYTMASPATLDGTRAVLVVVEAIPSATVAGRVEMSGIVATPDQANRKFIVGGQDILAEVAVGERLPMNGSPHNDMIYTVAAIVASGQDTAVTVAEEIAATDLYGRFQNSDIGEVAFAKIDELSYLAIARLVRGGKSSGDQFRTLDGGATWQSLGRTNAPNYGHLSCQLTVQAGADRTIVDWWYCRRDTTSTDPLSVAYRAGDAYALLLSAKAWGPEQVIVSNTSAMAVEGQANVSSSATYRRHGYPSPFVSRAGGHAMAAFHLETAQDKADLYLAPLRLEHEQFYGGWIKVGAYTLAGTGSNLTLPECMEFAREIRVLFRGSADKAGTFGLRVSEDYGRTFKSTGDYAPVGNAGSATSYLPMHNASIAIGVATECVADLFDFNLSTSRTRSRSSGGTNNASTTGSTVNGSRVVAARGTHLYFLHTDVTALVTGTLEVWGKVR